MKPRNKLEVGHYPLGHITVKLVFDPSISGGSFDFGPEDSHVPTMVVGGDSWRRSFEVLCHEAYEMAYVTANVRYVPSLNYARDNGAYVFSMTHTQFSECSVWASRFVFNAMADLKKARLQK